MNWPMLSLITLSGGALTAMLLIALTNVRTFRRLTQGPLPNTAGNVIDNQSINDVLPNGSAARPHVSILVPARNEAMTIAPTIMRLLNQAYPAYEVLVLNDNSNDATAAIARAAAGADPRLRVLDGQPLPVGWLGKPWACHQLSQAAAGEFLIFTDADVVWQPHALSALVAQMQASRADLLTVWPTQRTVTWSERLVVPLMAMAVLAYLPQRMAHDVRMVQAAAANGQCMAFRRQAYFQCGGHMAVAGRIVEDIALAEQIKRAGLKLRMADGNQLISCRMYHDWSEVLNGYTKNILAGHRNSVAFLLLSMLFHLLLFVAPLIWLLWGFFNPSEGGWPWIPLALLALGMATRALTARASAQRMVDALLMPVSVLLMTTIALNAIWQHFRHGGPQWKGRIVSEQASLAPSSPRSRFERFKGPKGSSHA